MLVAVSAFFQLHSYVAVSIEAMLRSCVKWSNVT